jgi:hypothetical protein
MEQKVLTHHAPKKRPALCVKAVWKKMRQGGVIKLYTTVTDGSIEELTTKKEMEQACMIENEGRFSQAEDTPFMTSPLLKDFRYLANTDAADQVLKGTYKIPPNMNPYTALLFKQLQMIDSSLIPTIPTTLSGRCRKFVI